MPDRREDRSPALDRASGPLDPAAQQRRHDAVAMVEEALRHDRVLLAFQPVVATQSRDDRPAFYEALIRVLDKGGRVIPARDFIFDVEATELGRRLDATALRHGFRTLREQPHLRLSVNLSARSIGFPLWTDEFERGVAADPTAADRLILEVTESSAITMPRLVGDFIDRLQARGVSFAIDDFGAGHTSMRYLKDFRFDLLKMDGEICRHAATNPDNRALVSAIVSIARHFDMVTVAECVETAADARALAALGVDCLQGHFFGAPSIRPRWEDCSVLLTGAA
jgi:EAL domain-containing protein (putative c-di-GMP-specific phosphodiesterase class I)